MGDNSFSKELLVRSQKGKYLCACSRGLGLKCKEIHLSIQGFTKKVVTQMGLNLLSSASVQNANYASIFQFVFFSFFFNLITVITLLNTGCIVTGHQVGTFWHCLLSSISPTFLSGKSSTFYQTGQEPFWNCHMPHSVKRLVFFFFFPEERGRAHMAFSCPDELTITSCVYL